MSYVDVQLTNGVYALKADVEDFKQTTLDTLYENTQQILSNQETQSYTMLILDMGKINTVLSPYAKNIMQKILELWGSANERYTAIITDSPILTVSVRAFFHLNQLAFDVKRANVFSSEMSATNWLNTRT